jgi:hypothetical protein
LDAYDPVALDETDRMRRHPSWVALCRLELGEQRGEPFDENVASALSLARSGFAHLSGRPMAGEGEVLWAIAETASEVGWSDRAAPLMDLAEHVAFADPENLNRVRLIQLMASVDATDADEAGRVEQIETSEHVDDQTFVHAMWIGAHLDRASGRLPRALERLQVALERIDEEETPDVHARIRGMIQALGAGDGSVADA